MKGFKLFLYYFLQWTWGILQNVIGLIMRVCVLAKDKNKDSFKFFGAQVTEWTGGHGSMGMGMFIFFGHKGEKDEKEVLVHEYGHTWQSAVLGPLYLLVIGIPSFTWAFFPYFTKLRKKRAYATWTSIPRHGQTLGARPSQDCRLRTGEVLYESNEYR